MAGKLKAQIGDEVRRGHGARADDRVIHSSVKVGLHRVLIAYAAANLDFHLGMRFGDVVDDAGVHGPARSRAIQIYDVQPLRASLNPSRGRVHRVVAIHGFRVHVALAQPHALAFFYVNRRDQQHDSVRNEKSAYAKQTRPLPIIAHSCAAGGKRGSVRLVPVVADADLDDQRHAERRRAGH